MNSTMLSLLLFIIMAIAVHSVTLTFYTNESYTMLVCTGNPPNSTDFEDIIAINGKCSPEQDLDASVERYYVYAPSEEGAMSGYHIGTIDVGYEDNENYFCCPGNDFFKCRCGISRTSDCSFEIIGNLTVYAELDYNINAQNDTDCSTAAPTITVAPSSTTNSPTAPTLEPIGCDQEPNSAKAVNECGLCLDSNDADFNQTGKDCKGICDGGHEWDKCGQCLLPRNISYNSCVGCDDIPYSGKKVNECGYCIFTNDTNISFANYGKDCRGKCQPLCSGNNTYKLDHCKQCLLESDPKWDICLKTPAPIPYLGPIVHIKWLLHLANGDNSASTANSASSASSAISDSSGNMDTSGNIDNPSISTPRKSRSGIYVSFGLILFILLGLCHISISICSRDKLSGQKTKGKSYKMVSINIDSNDDDDSLFNMDSTVDS